MTTTSQPETNLLCEYHDSDVFAQDVIDKVLEVLNHELILEYDCTVSSYGRERLLEHLALIHVEFRH